MKFAVVLLACVAAASAQFNKAYNSGAYNNGAYNPYNPYNNNPFGYNNYNRNQYQRYTTPVPYRTYAPISVTTPAPVPSPTPVPVSVPVPVVSRVVSDARNAQIVKYGNEVNPDGSFNYFFETENGIAAQEQGVPRDFGGNPPVAPSVAQGSFSWTSPEGEPIAISYVADENGYQPVGNAIPQPPPIPPQIARALEWIAKNAKQ